MIDTSWMMSFVGGILFGCGMILTAFLMKSLQIAAEHWMVWMKRKSK